MTTTPTPTTPPPAPTPIDSRRRFHEGLAWLLEPAVVRAARTLWFVDRDFADWPLGDAAVVDRLGAWLRLPQRRLVLLAAGYDELPRRHPRFANWRQDWTHAVQPFVAPEDLHERLPHLAFGDGGTVLQLFDAVHWRGRVGIDEAAARGWRDEIDAVLQRSEPGWPVRTLGL